MSNTIIHRGRGASAPILFDRAASNDSIFQPQVANTAGKGLSLNQPNFLIEDLWALELLEPEDRKEVLSDLGLDEDEILLPSENYYDASFERMYRPFSESDDLHIGAQHHYGEGSIPMLEAFIDLSDASAIEKQMIEMKNVPIEVKKPKKRGLKRLLGVFVRKA